MSGCTAGLLKIVLAGRASCPNNSFSAQRTASIRYVRTFPSVEAATISMSTTPYNSLSSPPSLPNSWARRLPCAPRRRDHPPPRPPWNYRNNMRYHVLTDGRLGLLRAGSTEPMPLETCFLPEPELLEMSKRIDLPSWRCNRTGRTAPRFDRRSYDHPAWFPG